MLLLERLARLFHKSPRKPSSHVRSPPSRVNRASYDWSENYEGDTDGVEDGTSAHDEAAAAAAAERVRADAQARVAKALLAQKAGSQENEDDDADEHTSGAAAAFLSRRSIAMVVEEEGGFAEAARIAYAFVGPVAKLLLFVLTHRCV